MQVTSKLENAAPRNVQKYKNKFGDLRPVEAMKYLKPEGLDDLIRKMLA